jgi:uncharacterized protein (DUF2235 family)
LKEIAPRNGWCTAIALVAFLTEYAQIDNYCCLSFCLGADVMATETAAGHLSKSIVLLSDGTGNSAAKVWRTNVWRLFQALDLKGSNQIAIYDDGVGTSSFLPLAILGGVFGFGLKRNVLNLYKFLCRNYQSDDKIYAFGFSRGAFTIRVVIGLVLNQGLVKFTSESELDKKARAAYRAYRYARFPGGNLAFPFLWLRHLVDKRFYVPW